MTTTHLTLALTGHPSSGKDSAAAYLVEAHGFVNVSLGDIIREYVTTHNLGDLSRTNLQQIGNQLRKENGAGYFAKEALKKEYPRMVISGVRSIGEAEEIQGQHIPLIAITAPIEKRYEWAKARGRIGENISFEEFKRIEEAEAMSPLPHEMNVSGVVARADYKIENDGTLDDLKKKISDLVERLTESK